MNRQTNHTRKKNRLYWLTLLLGMLCTSVFSEQFKFKHYNTSDGLPSNSIRCLTQDYRGFIWTGTENGVSRFNGRDFKVFKNIPGDSTSIGSNYINHIFEDSRKTIWIGTDCGVFIHIPETESFLLFSTATKENVQIKTGTTHITEDKKGNIWFSTEGQGVFCYNLEKKELQQFIVSPTMPDSPSNISFMLGFYIDSREQIWASAKTAKEPLYLFDEKKKQFLPYKIDYKTSPLIHIINEDSKGNIWLGSWDNGLYKLNIKDRSVKEFCSPQNKKGISHIHSISRYKDDALLVGSDDGLLIFNIDSEEYTMMISSELQNDGLSDKFVYPIFTDREGGLWIGTYYKGLNYSAPNKGYIEGFAHSEYKNSVCGNIISYFCEDPSGNIWIGSDDGGLSRFNPESQTFKNYSPVPGKNSLSYHNIHALMIDDGKLWIGTYSGGLNVMDIATEKFKLYLREDNNLRSLDGSSVYSIFKDNAGDIWVGTMQGLNKYNKKTDDFTRVKTTGTTTLDIIQEKDNTLWFATWGGGLFRYKPDKNEWKHYTSDNENLATIPHNSILSLCVDSEDRLWLGTENGLCYYDKENDSFVRESLKVPSISISNIIYYENDLWLSTANGFVQFSPKTKETRVFTTSDGLQNDQFTIKGSMLSSDNKMYLGTTDGFNIMCPRTFSGNEYIPPVVITNFQIFNKDLIIGKNNILKKAIEFTDKLTLTHKQNVLSIEFAALSYSAPSKNEYKYMLEGFDSEWNYVKNQQKATYTNLPAGTYVFHVMGSNNDGIWNEKATTLEIQVLPPFWRSTWAYIIYTLLIAASIFYIIYIIRKKTERKNKIRIKKLHAEKEKELYNAKINFFTQVAHEIRTPVSLIIGPLEKIIEQSKVFNSSIQNDLNIINRNSQRLLSLVNQLLDFRKAEQGSFKPHFTSQNIYELTLSIYDRFYPLITKKGINFEFVIENKNLMAMVDAEAYTKVISNLLTNAAKHTKSKITMSISEDNRFFSANVTDDGEGIPENEHNNIFKPFYQISESNKHGTGIGLSLVKLLVEAHHGMIDVSSAPGMTSFTITLPVLQTLSQESTITEAKTLAEVNDYSFLINEENEISVIADDNKPTLLIVEDNIDLCSFLHNGFKDSYNILITHNGKEGLDVLEKQTADIIVSDIMMPVMDGIRFCKEVKSNYLYSHIPFILLTAKIDSTTKVESLKLGADAYIEKPFSFQLLQVQIENLLNSRKLLKKKFSEMPFMTLDSIAGNKADELFLSKLNSIIESNISNTDFSIDVLAEQLCISRSGLFSKIKVLTDMTPNELIHLVRLKKAAELLSTKEYRINEICYQVGFNNPSYFSKCFQKQFGVLPKDFIQKQPINITP